MIKILKLFLLPLLLLSLPLTAKADSPSLIPEAIQPQAIDVGNIFSKLPNIKQGVAYDIEGSTFDYFTTAEFFSYQGFSLSGGYSTSDKIVASLDYDLINLKKLGVATPILDLVDVRVGAYVGIGNISTSNGEDRNKVAWGPEITIVSLKF